MPSLSENVKTLNNVAHTVLFFRFAVTVQYDIYCTLLYSSKFSCESKQQQQIYSACCAHTVPTVLTAQNMEYSLASIVHDGTQRNLHETHTCKDHAHIFLQAFYHLTYTVLYRGIQLCMHGSEPLYRIFNLHDHHVGQQQTLRSAVPLTRRGPCTRTLTPLACRSPLRCRCLRTVHHVRGRYRTPCLSMVPLTRSAPDNSRTRPLRLAALRMHIVAPVAASTCNGCCTAHAMPCRAVPCRATASQEPLHASVQTHSHPLSRSKPRRIARTYRPGRQERTGRTAQESIHRVLNE